jgi:hypothetical protein
MSRSANCALPGSIHGFAEYTSASRGQIDTRVAIQNPVLVKRAWVKNLLQPAA